MRKPQPMSSSMGKINGEKLKGPQLKSVIEWAL